MMHCLTGFQTDSETILTQVYHESFYNFRDRPSYRQDGRPGVWALDLRRPLSRSSPLRQICAIILAELEAANVHQVVGAGAAAGLIVGGLVANGRNIRGGIVRDHRKAYGFREQIEGALSRDHPVAIVDDILASGTTMVKVVDALEAEDYRIFAALPVFEFGWRDGRAKLGARGVATRPLAKLSYSRDPTAPVRTIWEVASSPKVVWEVEGTKPPAISESGT